MRKFLGTLVLLGALIIGVGWLRGWFELSTKSADDQTNIEFRIDKDKIKQDAEAAKAKAREITSHEDGPVEQNAEIPNASEFLPQ